MSAKDLLHRLYTLIEVGVSFVINIICDYGVYSEDQLQNRSIAIFGAQLPHWWQLHRHAEANAYCFAYFRQQNWVWVWWVSGNLKSGVAPFRKPRMSRQFLLQWRMDPRELHTYWPTLIEDEEAEFKRMELIAWKDEVGYASFRGKSVWREEKRNDHEHNT